VTEQHGAACGQLRVIIALAEAAVAHQAGRPGGVMALAELHAALLKLHSAERLIHFSSCPLESLEARRPSWMPEPPAELVEQYRRDHLIE
jgi:hypothetical protein